MLNKKIHRDYFLSSSIKPTRYYFMRVIGFVLLTIALGAAAITWLPSAEPITQNDTLKISASFYPLAEFARGAGGEYVEVTTIVPANSEPHEFEPTAQELAAIYTADLFIYNGSGFDPWAERIASDLERSGVRVINTSNVISSLLPASAEREESLFDPHFWLDPVLAIDQVSLVRDALVVVDPAHAQHYQRQSNTYQAQLQQLDQEYKAGLATCDLREIITAHNAFGYLARRYNLLVTPIAGLSPEEEPSARALAEIVQLAQDHEVNYIFFETMVSSKLAETVADEIGAATLVFNSIEGISLADQSAGKNYFSLMRDNLQNLRTALQCQ